jgi:cell division septation protein DedD
MSSGKKETSTRKSVRIELGRLALVGWIIGLFAALLWMFLLGIFVGKGLTPASINLAEIKKRMIAEGVWPGSARKQPEEKKPSEPTADQENIPVKDLEFYEALARKKKAQLSSPAPEKPAPQEQQSTTVAPAAAPAPRPESEKPQPSQQSPSLGHYTVQIASFKDLESAKKFSLSLKGIKPEATIRPVDLSGRGRWYRVQVGQLPSREQAGALAERLAKQYQLKAFIVRLDQ